jgi:subtilisin-like proprotein convertase family protein
MTSWRSWVLAILSCAIFSLSVVGIGWADKGGGSDANDPRSGAALNRDAAMHPQPAPPAIFPGSPQRINAAPVNDPSADATARDTQSETSVAVLGSNVVVAFNDSASSLGASKFTGYSHSGNVGGTFTDKGTLPTTSAGDAGDPNLAVHQATSSIYLATLSFNGTSQIPVFKSTDGGQTFPTSVNGIPGGVDLDKEWMAVDNFPGTGNGTIYLCATDFGFSPARVVVTHSTDGGTTFGPSGGVLLSNTGQSQGCSVAVGPDHGVHVAYFRGTGSSNDLFVRESTDGGVTFGIEHLVAHLNTVSVNGGLALNGGPRSNSLPNLAVNPISGHLVVVYNDDPNLASSADNGDIFYVRSTDSGATWSAPVRVNEVNVRDQFFPTVAITPNGKSIMFGYYDRSQDPDNLAFHRQGRAGTMNTTTGAIALRPSFQLSPNTPIAIGQDPVVASTYMGDYDQIAATDSFFHTTWSDNRDGNSFHAHQPDVRYAQISTAVTNSDLGVNVTPTPGTIDVGQDTTLTVTVAATGDIAKDVFVNLSPATGLKFKSAPGCKLDNQFIGCSLENIAAGTSKTITVVATGLGAGTRTVKATATTSSNDISQGNNSGSANVTVNSVPTTVRTFSTGNIAVPINDNTTVDVPLSVPNVGTVLKAQALVRLNHTFDSDLNIFLIDPSGHMVELSTHNGGGGDNYGSGANDCSGTPTTFNDSAATSIAAGAAPFAGEFKPEGSLADLIGDPSSGTWKLRVSDSANLDTGTIGCFKLKITVAGSADGSGTLTTPTTNVRNSSTGNTITFTYTAPAGGMTGGALRLTVPTGWSAPSVTGADPGFSTASAGALTVSGQKITLSNVTLGGGATFTLVYGSKASAGPGATAPSTGGVQTWQAMQKSIPGGTLTNLASSPKITVLSADGKGKLTTPTTTVANSSTGNTITFTYSAAAGGLANGALRLTVPTGWSAPSVTGANPGFSTASTGTLAVSGQRIDVTGLTLAGGATVTIVYGSTASGGPGATAPASPGAQTWQGAEKSSPGGVLTNLASSPSITVT